MVNGLLLTGVVMFIARPVSVFIALLPIKMHLHEKLFVGWVGLHGAVPIVLATFPLLAGLPQSPLIFDLVFFIVVVSVLLHGTTVLPVAKWLGVVTSASCVAARASASCLDGRSSSASLRHTANTEQLTRCASSSAEFPHETSH